MTVISSDRSRQFGTDLLQIKPDHVKRYQFASSRIGSRLRIIDVSCGIGYGSKILHDTGNQVLGVDIDEDAIKHANECFSGPRYLCADGTADFFGYRDIMVCFETLEHLEKPEKLLKCADAKGLIVSVPNEDVFPFAEYSPSKDKYPHRRHYTPTQFGDLLTQNGYSVREKWCQRDSGGAIYRGTKGRFLIYLCSK